MNPASTTDDLTTDILTMDVVDELRYRDARLAELAKQSYGGDELKARLAEIYRTQGIEVPDAVLEAGIKAQREKRFIYAPPTGFKARLARLWIKRSRVGHVAAAGILALAGLLSGYHFGWVVPAERDASAAIAELASKAALVPDRVISLAARFDVAQARLNASVEQAAHSAQSSRLSAAAVETESARDSLAAAISDALAKARSREMPPTLDRVDGVTRFVGAAPDWAVGKDPVLALRSRLEGMDAELDRVAADIQALEESAARLDRALSISVALDASNDALLEARLTPSVDQVRARYYAAGDAAVRSVKLQEASAAASRLATLGADAETVSAIASSLADLRQAAKRTGVAGTDLQEIEALASRVASGNTVESLPDAEGALKHLKAAVKMLEEAYVYRVVNRRGEKSGVWRYHENSPGSRNHYLVVEALDDQGKAATLPIRNEESGETELVNIFAVRVSEETYTRVGQDKMDNGIIDDDLVASKERGALNPTFKIPTAGGYITHW